MTVSSPDLVELFLKMSANRELMTTRNPPSSSAQQACSREEPVPKSGPATRIDASAYCGWLSTKSGSFLRQATRSEEHTSELQSRQYLVCRLLLEKKKNIMYLLLTHPFRPRIQTT